MLTNFGVDVTIVEFLDRTVPTEDADVSKELLKHFKKLGAKVLLGTRSRRSRTRHRGPGDRLVGRCAPAGAGGRQAPVGHRVRPPGPGLRLGSRPVVDPTDRGAIAIDDLLPHQRAQRLRHRRRHRQVMLAHVAEAQGIVAAETIAGADTMPDRRRLPSPGRCSASRRSASMGSSEAQAQGGGPPGQDGDLPVLGQRKAQGLGDAVGFVKIVADAEHNELLGAHLIGPDVTELLPIITPRPDVGPHR